MKKDKQNSTKELVRKYFDDVSCDYSEYQYNIDVRSYMSVRQDAMLSYFTNEFAGSGKKVLDAGCGSGQLMEKLTQRGFNVTGMDMSHEMLGLTRDKIRKISASEAGRLVAADIESIPFRDNAFDIVTTAGVIEYLENDEKVLKEFNRVLKSNGALVISVTNKYSYNLMLDNIFEYFRSKKFFFKIMNYISLNIIGHGELQPRKFIIRRHSPYAFRDFLKSNGFEIIDSKFFYFTLLPHPFNSLLFRFGKWLSVKLEILARTKLKIVGEGYLLICRKL